MTPPEETPTPSAGHRRATLFVKGHVQGVGFRWWTRSRALELGLVGHARNMSDGRVEVVAQGRGADIAALEALLREDPSSHGRPGRVDAVVRQEGDAREGVTGFVEK
ncbi:acylphosphatase [Kytococcus schroeteri]|uniref:acylphosphatase n=1 Tax=Kytococcus schroeteri TaxID=138300 RepID=A0A2I1PBJ8_9MICO|nr:MULTISPECIES: acylphosphatase [Kytococcus]OFS09856.1 acylphosphatase [Kytococcus sp. HMSC28H12]PKZ41995.1 acylphosphatase [Kytococcus schroeteri]